MSPENTATIESTSASQKFPPIHDWVCIGLLLSITLALYGASLYFNFVWDDWYYIRDNSLIQALDWQHLRRIWTSTHLGHYAPVDISVLALLHYLYGMDPFGYHLAQLLAHCACVILVYLLLKKLESGRVALLATLLFVVHPTNIETIAWVSELKSTLAFFFFLLSFWFFIRMRERERWTDGVLAGFFLVISMLAKINTVVAPAIFLLYDYKQGTTLKTLRWRSLAPFFLISAAMTVVHLRAFHGSAQTMESQYYGGVGTHIFSMPSVIAFYLQMIVFPHPLSAWVMFPAPDRFPWANILGWFGLAAMAWLLTRTTRNAQFWALWILALLLPVLQIIPFGIWVADRYLYIPAIGAFVLIAQLFFWWIDSAGNRSLQWGIASVMAAAVLVLAWTTERHLPVWRNDVTLWEATLPGCMTSAYCHNAYGLALMQQGYTERGGEELFRSVEMDPTMSASLVFLADAMTFNARDYQNAARTYNRALLAAREEKAKGQKNPFAISTIYARLARAYILGGYYDYARTALDRGMAADRKDPAILAMDVMLKWKLGDLGAARGALSTAKSAADAAGNSSSVVALVGKYWGDRAQVYEFVKELGSETAVSR